MVTREQVVAYRAAVHGLAEGYRGADNALLVGAQDHPTGSTARLALNLRGHDGDGVCVHSVRAAIHVHRPADLGLLAAALRIEDGNDLAKAAIGPFGGQVGAGFGAGIDQVAAAMVTVMSDGVARTKGELSGAVTPLVDERMTPWCAGCGVHHVHDALFRYATLQAGLTIEAESPKVFRFLPPVQFDQVSADAARAELVRRFLHAAGPATPAQLASWLTLTPAVARRWWSLVADELEQVSVGGHAAWVRGADLDLLTDPPAPDAVRLLGPYDPLTELADREFTVPDPADRRRVWGPAGNPGIVVVNGEIAGMWRRRSARGSLTLKVAPFGSLPTGWAQAVSHDARVIGRFFGAKDVQLEPSA